MDKPKPTLSTTKLIIISIAGGLAFAVVGSLLAPPHALWNTRIWTLALLFAALFVVMQYSNARIKAYGKRFPSEAVLSIGMKRTCYLAGAIILAGILAFFLVPVRFAPAFICGAFAVACFVLAVGAWRKPFRRSSPWLSIGGFTLMGFGWLLITLLIFLVGPEQNPLNEGTPFHQVLTYTAIGLLALGLITFLLSLLWLAKHVEKLPPSP